MYIGLLLIAFGGLLVLWGLGYFNAAPTGTA